MAVKRFPVGIWAVKDPNYRFQVVWQEREAPTARMKLFHHTRTSYCTSTL